MRTKNKYVKVLYKGHVIRPGDIVSAGGLFKVIRVWGHHATLEPVADAQGKTPIPISTAPDPSADGSLLQR
jgi:hypothetical protein